MEESQKAPPTPERLCPSRPRSIRSKATISLLLIAAIGLVATAAAHRAILRLESKIQIIESFYELNQKILETRRHEKNFLLYGTRRDLLDAREYLGKVRAAVAPVKKFLGVSGELNPMPHETELNEYEAMLDRLSVPNIPAAQMETLKDELRSKGQDLTGKVLEMDTMARWRVENEARRYHFFSFAVIGLNIVVSLIVAFFLIRWMIGPLNAIREAAARVVRGELTVIPMGRRICGSIESEELVNTLNLMLDTLAAKQNQLVQSAKLAVIGRVTAGIAHEINNPLNNISLTSEVLLEDLPNMDCADRLEMVRDILVQADRAREVVRHLLDFSRSRKPTGWEPVDLVKITGKALALLKNQLRIGQQNAVTEFPDQPILISGNANQLEQVLVNIILNAIQASPQGGTITISAGKALDMKQAWITVTDSGPGIPDDVRQQLFEPFFSTKSEGTGLGLSVSYAIIREHNGEIVVHNRPEGGAMFRIQLPLAG